MDGGFGEGVEDGDEGGCVSEDSGGGVDVGEGEVGEEAASPVWGVGALSGVGGVGGGGGGERAFF